MNTPTKIILHHTGGTDAQPLLDTSGFTFKQCNDLHKERFNFISSLGYYVGYQYFIERDGKVYQARKDTEEGAHTIGQNSSSIGICMAGNFDVTMPTVSQINSLKKLISEKMAQYNIPVTRIYPHRRYAVKTCYGNNLSDKWFQDIFNNKTAISLPVVTRPKYNFTVAMGWSYTPSVSVKALQNILKYERCLPENFVVDGKFQEATARALKTWQISHGITDFQLETDLKKIRAGMKTLIKLNELYSK